jgi:hypothetical protein
MAVEGERRGEFHALHDGETGAVGVAEIQVPVSAEDIPR